MLQSGEPFVVPVFEIVRKHVREVLYKIGCVGLGEATFFFSFTFFLLLGATRLGLFHIVPSNK